jgi:hypothetical protein
MNRPGKFGDAATRHDLILAPARMATAFDRVLRHQI